MKKFKFKLQPLFTYKKYQERIAQQKTAKAHLDVKNCEQQIVDLEQTWDQQADIIENAIEKGIPASQFQRYYQYLAAVETSIVEERFRKIGLDKTLNEKLLELKKKSVDKKAMELYCEKMKTQYNQEVIQIEQKELDEISILKTARTKAQ
ncbi:MAG: flagellar FliJ family protein [Pseudomonadota bacterium]